MYVINIFKILHLGSAHTVLASFWSSRLQRNDFYGKYDFTPDVRWTPRYVQIGATDAKFTPEVTSDVND